MYKSFRQRKQRWGINTRLHGAGSLAAAVTICLASGLFLVADPAFAQVDVVRSMADLIEKNKSDEAYALGVLHKGDPTIKGPEFDLWLGVAALEVGQPREALEALRRFMQENPAHAQIPRARVELGRALLVAGDSAGALVEFKAALAQNPPQTVVGNIKAMIALTEAQAPPKIITGYLELGLGHDSNTNGGTSNADVTLPVLGLVTLNSGGVKMSAGFGSVAGGAQLNYPLTSAVSVIGSAQGEAKLHDRHTEFDLRTGNLAGGLAWRGRTQQLRAVASYATLAVDDKNYRESTTFGVDGSQAIGARGSLSLSVSAGELRYEADNALRNARVRNVGAGYQHTFAMIGQPVLNFYLGYGDENNTRSRPDLGRNLTSARVAITVRPASRWTVSTGYTQVESRYNGIDALFLVTRADTYRSVDLVATYALAKNLSVRAELNKAKNDSNVALWQNERELFALKLRYDFR